ncbi:MAG: ATP-dependent helicase [Clostridiales bacterium]|nr:ATP-dependent helicase [Clostridiales bacterium]
MVEFIESSQLIDIYKDDFNFKVYAGPGAGKTYFLIENIKDTIENSQKLKLDANRKILCITYTNVAVNEIKSRLGQYNKNVVVKTIHSFLYEYVIKPYQQQLKILINETFNIHIDDKVRMYPRLEGFGLLSKLKVSDFIGVLQEKYELLVASELSKKKISECVLDISSINHYPFCETDIPSIKRILGMTDADLLKLKTALWEQEGVLDFDEILYFSYILLKRYKFIGYDVQYVFPYILMDEYQDTNPIQNKILQLLCSKNVSVGVVGDKAQSIYGFVNSTYKEFDDFHPNIKDFKTFVIDGNRRSNQNIIYFLNYIRQVDKTLNEQKCLINNNSSKVKFVLCKDRNADLLKKLDVKDIRVLCRRWADAFEYITDIEVEQRKYLKEVHDYYRYVLDRDLTKDFENSNINWINNVNIIISIYKAIRLGNFASILKELAKIFDIDILKLNNRSKGQEFKEIVRFVNLFRKFNEDTIYYDIINSINQFIDQTSLKAFEKLELISDDNELFRDEFHPFLHSLNIRTLKVMFDDVFSEDSKYVTVHKTKGKEYDSVLVNLTPVKDEWLLGGILKVLENPVLFNSEFDNVMEFARIAYVAFSRARNNLFIHLKNTKAELGTLIANLQDYCFKHNIKEAFYEIIDLN